MSYARQAGHLHGHWYGKGWQQCNHSSKYVPFHVHVGAGANLSSQWVMEV